MTMKMRQEMKNRLQDTTKAVLGPDIDAKKLNENCVMMYNDV